MNDIKAAKKPSASYNVPAVDKAIDIIEYLANRRSAANISNIAEDLGRSVSEIYRIILALERRRLIFKEPSGDQYRLSLRLFELNHFFPPIARLVDLAQPVLDELSQKTDQSCHLAVAEGNRLIIIAAAESPLPMHYSVKKGASFDLLETSSGVIISAYSDDKYNKNILSNLNLDQQELIRTRIDSIKELGFEAQKSLVVDGLINLSVPIKNMYGKVVAALTIPFLNQSAIRFSQEQVLKRLVETSELLSTRIG